MAASRQRLPSRDPSTRPTCWPSGNRQASSTCVLPSDDNIFGGPPLAPAGIYRAFSDGYWIGLPPFTRGSYELNFGGKVDRTGPFAGQSFSQDITYRITAVPEPGTIAMMLAGLGVFAGIAAKRRAG